MLFKIYEFLTLTLPNALAWRCPTSVLIPFYRAHAGKRAHLSIGDPTGYYIAGAADALAHTPHVTFLVSPYAPSSSPSAASSASTQAVRRLRSVGYAGTLDTVTHSVLDPLPPALHERFDSVALFFVLDHLTGAFPIKASHVFADIRPAVAPGGCLYGATVLADAPHGMLGRLAMWWGNWRGRLRNQWDYRTELERALRCAFEEVETELVGGVLLFVAKKPRERY